jgi:hypothetical protein
MFNGLKLAGDHIVARRFEDEITLINLDTGDYFAAGGFAVDLFESLSGPVGVDGLMAMAHDRFAGDTALMDADIQRICAQFVAAGLIVDDATVAGRSVTAVTMAEDKPAWPGAWLEAYGDMKEMLLLDPIHDVGDGEWPPAPTAD